MDSKKTSWLAVSALAIGLAGCGSSNSNSPGSGGGAVSSSGSDGSAGGVVVPDARAADGGCQSGDTKACTTFTTPTGITLVLGPYGAAMDPNVGTGFENPVAAQDEPDAASACVNFARIFDQSAALTADLLNTNQDGLALNFALYTVYRPATWPAGPIPVITWGNGTCAQPEGYGALLRYVASYGFFIVAANSREVSAGTPMLHALDYAKAANADSTSPYYQKLDLTKVGAMGHSQGGMATVSAATDSRVQDVIIFNAADSCTKPFLAISGDKDITGFTPSTMASAADSAPAPGAWIYYYDPIGTGPNGSGNLDGHLVLMTQPNRVTGPAVAWWQMVFQSSATATSEFVGANCGLCDGDVSTYAYGEHDLPPGSVADAGPTGDDASATGDP